MLTVLDLFSGIGGISLGLECTGMKTVAFCEIEKFQRAVLAHHWPEVPIYDDITKLSAAVLSRDGIHGCDVIAGGFPCQDISVAGKGAGIEKGERSGLWREMYRLICELRPTWVLAENVPALRTRGADRVISDLEAAGYTVEPLVVGAWAVGAPHKRDRVWVIGCINPDVANRESSVPCKSSERERRENPRGRSFDNSWNQEEGADVAYSNEDGQHRLRRSERIGEKAWVEDSPRNEFNGCRETVAHSEQMRRVEGRRESGDEGGEGERWNESSRISSRSVGLADACEAGSEERHAPAEPTEPRFGAGCRHAWPARPGEQQHEWEEARLKWPVGAATDGISERLVRRHNRLILGAAGNSVVPQVVEVIGRAIADIARGIDA